MTHTIEFYTEREQPDGTLAEVTVEVEYETTPACRGARDRFGAPLEPDEDAGIEIVSTSIPLTAQEEARCEEHCAVDAEARAFDMAHGWKED